MKPEWVLHDPYIASAYIYPTIASSIAYGAVLCLSIACASALRKGRQYTKRRKWSLYLYIAVAVILSTASIGEDIWIIKSGIVNLLALILQLPTEDWNFSTSSILIAFDYDWALAPFAIWAADGFMTWRCIVLYEGTSKSSRVILIAVLALLNMTSLAFGILSLALATYQPFVNANGKEGPYNTWAFALLCVSAGVNITLSALIVVRIRYHQNYIRKTLGTAHGSIYTRIMVMCIESCAMIWVFDILYIVLSVVPLPEVRNDAPYFPLVLIPHICVISPLFIIYRVATGSDSATKTFNATDLIKNGLNRVEGHIAFRNGESTNHSELV